MDFFCFQNIPPEQVSLQSKVCLKCSLSKAVQSTREGGALATCLPGSARVCGCRGTRRHTGTHFPRAAQSKSCSHLKGCQLSRPSLRAQPPPHSSTPHAPPLKSDSLLSLVFTPLTPFKEPINRILVGGGGANGDVRCGSCRVRVPGGGAEGGVLVAD